MTSQSSMTSRTMSMSMKRLYPIMLDSFEKGESFTMITNGTSMMPFIGNGCDAVRLCRADTPPKKYDIILYRRDDGSFVLHRIIGKNKNGYILCGDNQFIKEYGIKPEAIIARAECVIKNAKPGDSRPAKTVECGGARYTAYCIALNYSRPLRRLYRKLKSVLKHVLSS